MDAISHTHTPPRTPRVRQKSPRRGGTEARTFGLDRSERRPVTRLLARTREVELFVRRSQWYRVDLDRIPDAAALLGWIEHLLQKTWCTSQHVRELITYVERENEVVVNRAA